MSSCGFERSIYALIMFVVLFVFKEIIGAADTPYEKGIFDLEIVVPER